jgi:hypothetical protein
VCGRGHPVRHVSRRDIPDAAWQRIRAATLELAEKERRSGCRRTVEGYARMLWPFLGGIGSPDRVTPKDGRKAHDGGHCSGPTAGVRLDDAGSVRRPGSRPVNRIHS